MTEEMQKIYEALTAAFEGRKFADLRIKLLDMEPADIANYMEEELDEKEQLMFFRLLPKVFEDLSPQASAPRRVKRHPLEPLLGTVADDLPRLRVELARVLRMVD